MAALGLALSGCGGRPSVLNTAGEDAAPLATLFWVMLVGAAVVWLLLNGLMLHVWRMNVARMSSRKAGALIIGGGIVFPTVVIGALLAYGLSVMPDMRAEGTGTRLEVTGEQWWWRVAYHPEGGGAPVIAANEIVLPAGSRTEITLEADRVSIPSGSPPSAARPTRSPAAPRGCRRNPPSPASIAAGAPSSAAKAMPGWPSTP